MIPMRLAKHPKELFRWFLGSGVVVTLMFALALTGCGDANRKAGSKVLRINLAAKPLSLDPRVGGDMRSLVITRMLFEGLMRTGPDDKQAFAAADGLEISDDGRVYTFHMRPSKWSNGDPVTAHDFEYAWKTAISPDSPTQFAYAFYPIQYAQEAKKGLVPVEQVGVVALSDETLQVTLEYPTPYFLQLVANPIYSPIHRRTDRQHPNWSVEPSHYVSNGPFILQGWKMGEEIKCGKNPFYWDADSVLIDGIRVLRVEDGNTAQLMFEQGQLDYIGEPLCTIPIDCIKTWEKSGQLKTRAIAGDLRYSFNTGRFPLTNASVRRALGLAIDRQAVVDSLLGRSEPITMSILPPSLTLHPEPLYSDGDRENALAEFRKGLAELNLKPETFPTLTLSYQNLEGHKAVAQAIQQQWQDLFGISIRLEGVEYGISLYNLQHRQYEIGSAGWTSWFHDPLYNLEALMYRSQSQDWPGWEDDRFIELVERSRREPQRRKDLLKAAEALIAEEMPIAPIYTLVFRYVHRPNIEGIYIAPTGHIDFRWTKIHNDK